MIFVVELVLPKFSKKYLIVKRLIIITVSNKIYKNLFIADLSFIFF